VENQYKGKLTRVLMENEQLKKRAANKKFENRTGEKIGKMPPLVVHCRTPFG